MTNKLFVRNLSPSTVKPYLQDLFSQAGKVVSISMPIDRSNWKARGYAFIEMGSPAEAAKAIALLNGKQIDGHRISVREQDQSPE